MGWLSTCRTESGVPGTRGWEGECSPRAGLLSGQVGEESDLCREHSRLPERPEVGLDHRSVEDTGAPRRTGRPTIGHVEVVVLRSRSMTRSSWNHTATRPLVSTT